MSEEISRPALLARALAVRECLESTSHEQPLNSREVKAWDLAQHIVVTFSDPAPQPATSTVEVEPTHWEAYWLGAGSVDSITRMTHIESLANSWRERGAKLTPLVPASVLSAALEDKKRAERERDSALKLLAMSRKAKAVEKEHIARVMAEARAEAMATAGEILATAACRVHPTAPSSEAMNALSRAIDQWTAAHADHARAALAKERSE